ncbi:MAG: hypothetical protein Q4A74_07780 [Cardiobacteriaceae bacterium]|nr:hypothetical protein [Cardiobacteriaceae bacterium]
MEQRQRFGLRKSKAYKLCGAVLATFFIVGAHTAYADENSIDTVPTNGNTSITAEASNTTAAISTSATNNVVASEAIVTPTTSETVASETATQPISLTIESVNTTTSETTSEVATASETASETPRVRARRSVESNDSINVTLTTDNTDKTVTATSSTETPAKLNTLPPHVFNINASGVGEIPENSYVEVRVQTNSDLSQYNTDNPLEDGFKATGYTTNKEDYKGSTQTAKINISGLSAGTQKQFIVEPNKITESFPVSSNFARVTTYKLIIDGVVKDEKTITETFIPKEPHISIDTHYPNSLLRSKMPGKPDTDIYSSNSDSVTLIGKRNYGKYKVTLPKTVKLPEYANMKFPEQLILNI